MRRFPSRGALLLAACAATSAAAFWSADGGSIVVANGSAVALVDARTGNVSRAFPRHVAIRGALTMPSTPSPIESPLLTRERVMLSRDGGRLVNSEDGVDVWNVAGARLELRIPRATASALLGEHGDLVAVVRAGDGAAREFSVWDAAAGTCVFSHLLIVPDVRVAALRTDSDRYAAFTVAQRELWLWSREHGLQRLALPQDFFVNVPLRFSADGTLVAVSGQSDRRRDAEGSKRIVVYDLRDGQPRAEHRVERGNTPTPLGWSPQGESLIASVRNSPDLLQYDARSGALRHRWEYTAPFKVKLSGGGLLESRVQARLVGRVPLRGENAVLSGPGDRLALADPVSETIVAWDVSATPPRRLPDVCGGGCGELLPVEFSPAGRELLVFGPPSSPALRLWPLDGGAPREIGIDLVALMRMAFGVTLPKALPEPDPRARGCDGGVRDACLAKGDFERACLMQEDARCLAGLREASLKRKPIAVRKPVTSDQPGLCDDLGYLRVAAVRAFENGEFSGIRIVRIVGDARGRWPFEPGDELRNSVRCDPASCTPQELLQEVSRLCRIPADKLLRNIQLEIRSTVPERNRDIVLRRIAP